MPIAADLRRRTALPALRTSLALLAPLLTPLAALAPLAAITALTAAASAPLAALAAETPANPANPGTPEIVTVPSAGSPLVAIRLLFRAGSIDDPPGKEGLASLTSLMVAQASTTKHPYSQLLEALYPLAAHIDSNTDREVTVFSGTVTRESLDTFSGLLTEALLAPAFAEADFRRNKQLLLSALTDNLRSGNDEMLGLEALQDELFAHHPYGHPAAGTVAGLDAVTLDDVRAFYRSHYTRANLMIGIAGGYPAGFAEQLAGSLATLPAGEAGQRSTPRPLPPAPQVTGRRITIVDKQTDSVGITLGFPLPVTRKDADYFPLMVANSFLGEHRTFTGLLMVELRQLRGLNYGDYSYIEYWDAPPFTSHPPPNVPRREQYFSVWLRPVVPSDTQFALRAALYELGRLHADGMTREQFELTRDFVINYSKLWVQDLSSRLGYHMDSRWYGTPYLIDEIDARLRKLTVEDVNRAIAKYLDDASFDAVIVSPHGAELKELLARDAPSPKKYNSAVSADVLAADKTIVALPVHPTSIDVVPVSRMFEK